MNQQLSYFHISWLSETDGPGKRIVLFLQGCPLDCAWCHSPHSQPAESPLLFSGSLCIHCHRCEAACANGVHSFVGQQHIIQRERCVKCGDCIEACPQSSFYKQGNALSLPTKRCDIDLLFDLIKPQLELLRDEGGITFSGGEPLLQAEPLTLLAKKCKTAGFNTALETSGIVPLKSIKMIEPYIDTWLFGMRLITGTKTITPQRLEEQSRKALHLLSCEKKATVVVRIPAIAGYTSAVSYLDRVNEIVGGCPVHKIEVLPHNRESSHYYYAMGDSPFIDYNEKEADAAFQIVTNYFNINQQSMNRL
jgi:glycyl-radical enzyme activating protein